VFIKGTDEEELSELGTCFYVLLDESWIFQAGIITEFDVSPNTECLIEQSFRSKEKLG
jgi:hypothetical protein